MLSIRSATSKPFVHATRYAPQSESLHLTYLELTSLDRAKGPSPTGRTAPRRRPHLLTLIPMPVDAKPSILSALNHRPTVINILGCVTEPNATWKSIPHLEVVLRLRPVDFTILRFYLGPGASYRHRHDGAPHQHQSWRLWHPPPQLTPARHRPVRHAAVHTLEPEGISPAGLGSHISPDFGSRKSSRAGAGPSARRP